MAHATHAANGWVAICRSREVGSQPVHFELHGDHDVVLVRHGGRLLAMSNRCPHKEARLHRSGDIEDLGGNIGLFCPKHRSKFGGGLFVSFENGKCSTRSPCSRSDRVAQWTVPTYDAKEEEKMVWVRPRPKADEPRPKTDESRTGVHAPSSGETEIKVEAAEPRLAARLQRVRQVSPDTYEFTLQLESSHRDEFAREPAVMWHIWLHVRNVSREYTPLSSALHTAQTGVIKLIIKLYKHGRMSEALAVARVGERVAVGPPRKTLQVPALERTEGIASDHCFNLLAGGTGIAPCLQLTRRALSAGVAVRLVYSVRTREDVLLAEELAALAEGDRRAPSHSTSHPMAVRGGGSRFHYALVLSQEDEVQTAEASTAAHVRPIAKRPRTSAAVYGRRIDMATVQEHLLGMEGLGEGQRAAGSDMRHMTIISGPAGFNEHCEGLVRRMVRAEAHGVFVLDA